MHYFWPKFYKETEILNLLILRENYDEIQSFGTGVCRGGYAFGTGVCRGGYAFGTGVCRGGYADFNRTTKKLLKNYDFELLFFKVKVGNVRSKKKVARLHFILPNQELSGAKSGLHGEMVGECSTYKRGGQPPYNCALRSLQICLHEHV